MKTLNKLQVLETLPSKNIVAFSGGVDSVVLTEFLLEHKKELTLAHFIHAESPSAEKEFKFVREYAEKKSLRLIAAYQIDQRTKQSKELYWRNARNRFFKDVVNSDVYETQGIHSVLTGHHLNDAVEWYLMTCLRGEGHFMKYRNEDGIKRPFITQTKKQIYAYAINKGLDWVEDTSNANPEFATRNYIRANVIPGALHVNPGLFTTVKNRILKNYAEDRGCVCLMKS